MTAVTRPTARPTLFVTLEPHGLQEHGWSEEASFVTPPLTGPDASVKLLAIADMGQAEVRTPRAKARNHMRVTGSRTYFWTMLNAR